mmetsp:Transcript_97772/g.154071  ORF Transcript_97772/g.154071 Transcript_97772/m.154071 type:complete len:211 (+) Transcript_97772:37-669(+)
MPSNSSAQAAPEQDELNTCEKPTLPEVIESIGCGPAQIRFCLTGGGVYLADGSELLLISAVTQSLAADWSLTPFERGLVVTIVFIGVLVGNVICGPLGDRYGRRGLIISSYLGVFVFSILSSFAESYRTLCIFRVLVGFSFGIGQPAWNTLATEVTPRFWRIPMQGRGCRWLYNRIPVRGRDLSHRNTNDRCCCLLGLWQDWGYVGSDIC